VKRSKELFKKLGSEPIPDKFLETIEYRGWRMHQLLNSLFVSLAQVPLVPKCQEKSQPMNVDENSFQHQLRNSVFSLLDCLLNPDRLSPLSECLERLVPPVHCQSSLIRPISSAHLKASQIRLKKELEWNV